MNHPPYVSLGSWLARTAGRRRSLSIVRMLIAGLAAHVTIDPSEVPGGRFARLAFRVPTERDDASITSFAVRLPTEHPIKHVSVRPDPRWSYEVETTPLPAREQRDGMTETVSKITWTGGEICPGEFDEFVVALGPLPDDADRLLFPAVETYDDGTLARFDGERAESPDHPTPAVTLVDPADARQPGSGGGAAAASGRMGTPARSPADKGLVDSVRRRATAGVLVGAIGLGAAVLALIRAYRRS